MRIHCSQAAPQPDNPKEAVNMVLSGLEVFCELRSLGQSNDHHDRRVSKDSFGPTSLKCIDAGL